MILANYMTGTYGKAHLTAILNYPDQNTMGQVKESDRVYRTYSYCMSPGNYDLLQKQNQ